MSQLIQLNVVAIPDETDPVHEEVCRKNLLLGQQFATHFVLDKRTLPHLSLYQTCYPPGSRDKVVSELSKLTQYLSVISITLPPVYDLFWGTFLFWDAEVSPRLNGYHRNIVTKLNPLREGYILPIHRELLNDQGTSKEQKEAIRQTGNPLALATFRPHFTITRFKAKEEAEVGLRWQKDNPAPTLSFEVKKLYLANVGPNGTVTETYEEFPLKG